MATTAPVPDSSLVSSAAMHDDVDITGRDAQQPGRPRLIDSFDVPLVVLEWMLPLMDKIDAVMANPARRGEAIFLSGMHWSGRTGALQILEVYSKQRAVAARWPRPLVVLVCNSMLHPNPSVFISNQIAQQLYRDNAAYFRDLVPDAELRASPVLLPRFCAPATDAARPGGRSGADPTVEQAAAADDSAASGLPHTPQLAALRHAAIAFLRDPSSEHVLAVLQAHVAAGLPLVELIHNIDFATNYADCELRRRYQRLDDAALSSGTLRFASAVSPYRAGMSTQLVPDTCVYDVPVVPDEDARRLALYNNCPGMRPERRLALAHNARLRERVLERTGGNVKLLCDWLCDPCDDSFDRWADMLASAVLNRAIKRSQELGGHHISELLYSVAVVNYHLTGTPPPQHQQDQLAALGLWNLHRSRPVDEYMAESWRHITMRRHATQSSPLDATLMRMYEMGPKWRHKAARLIYTDALTTGKRRLAVGDFQDVILQSVLDWVWLREVRPINDTCVDRPPLLIALPYAVKVVHYIGWWGGQVWAIQLSAHLTQEQGPRALLELCTRAAHRGAGSPSVYDFIRAVLPDAGLPEAPVGGARAVPMLRLVSVGGAGRHPLPDGVQWWGPDVLQQQGVALTRETARIMGIPDAHKQGEQDDDWEWAFPTRQPIRLGPILTPRVPSRSSRKRRAVAGLLGALCAAQRSRSAGAGAGQQSDEA